MLPPPPRADDSPFGQLLGAEIPSEVTPGVVYRLVWQLGEGGMSVVFYALRVTAEGHLPVVAKLLKPAVVIQAGPTAALIVKKEAIALGRLNERVPPTPFVVRYIDTGTFPVPWGGTRVDVPWVVVEYVHGGAEGTTLSQRVDHSFEETGYAFDPARAAHAVECLATGLAAVHEVGVIHRDIKPDNVLCCGFGAGEIFKLADFGVARPVGVATFIGSVVGTPGFVAPELMMGDSRAIGPWSDVFSLAIVFFFLLTGEEYFGERARNPGDALVTALSETRRSVLDAEGLSPELRARDQACRSIDAALAAATAGRVERRIHRADLLAAVLLPWLRIESARPVRRVEVRSDEDDDPTRSLRWQWNTMRAPRDAGLVVRSVAWDGDGRAMAATSRGLAFWNGSSWVSVGLGPLPDPGGIRFVQRVGAGQWLVGGDDATFASVASEGLKDVRKLESSPCASFDRMSGDLDDLAVLVGQSPGEPPVLCARSGKRWLKPLPLPEVAALSSLARVDDTHWLLAGRGTDGRGLAALYAPLDWEVERLDGPTVRAYLACAGQVDHEVGIATGAGGAVVLRRGQEVTYETIPGEHDLSAAAIDEAGRAWAASAGRIWLRRAGGTARWDCIWEDAGWTVPIVSLDAGLGGVVAMTADGGVIEGWMMRGTGTLC